MMKNRWKKVVAFLLTFALVISMLPVQSVEATKKTVKTTSISTTNVAYKTMTIAKGKTYQIKTEVKPATATNKKLVWSTSNKKIATVSSTGLVKGIRSGTAVIKATTKDGSKKQIAIKVTIGTKVSKISVAKSKVTLKVGKTSTIKATVSSKKASNKKLAYKSSNNKVATVSSKGKIKAVGKGTATITVEAKDNSGKTAKVKVTVKGNDATISNKNVENGTATISNASYDDLTISNSVGNASVVLDHVVIRGTLKMQNGAAYTVSVTNCNIANVMVDEKEADVKTMAVGLDEPKTIDASTLPTLIAGKGTVIVELDAVGNVSIKQNGSATIKSITVSTKLNGNITVSLDGFKGNLEIKSATNSNVNIETKACEIGTATVSGSVTGQKIQLLDKAAEGETASKIDKINLTSNASLKVDIQANTLQIDKKAANAHVTIEKAIDSVNNNGKDSNLTINADIKDFTSNGDAAVVKIGGGATVEAIRSDGANAKISVALGATVTKVTTRGDKNTIEGDGKVGSVKVEGNDTKVNTKNTQLEIADNVKGTQSFDKTVKPGETVNTGTAGGSTGGTTDPGAASGEAVQIVIENPGTVVAGTPVTLKANMSNVTWKVYDNISSSMGVATIDASTGKLDPVDPGIVRVEVRSKANKNAYGVVDIHIQGKKVVSYKELPTIVLNKDEKIMDLSLLKASGKLPKDVEIVYEDNNTVGTLKTTLDDHWYGDFDGGRLGKYMITGNSDLPDGYGGDDYCNIRVIVDVQAKQTDDRIAITGYDQLPELTLSEDTHAVKGRDVLHQFIWSNKKDNTFTLKAEDGTTHPCEIYSYYSSSADKFNGTVPGKYVFEFDVEMPVGYKAKQANASSGRYRVERTVNVVTPQTVSSVDFDEDSEAPSTTQTAFKPKTEAITISGIEVNAPATMKVGEVLNLNALVTVAPDKEAYKFVTWKSSNGNDISHTNGTFLASYKGMTTITATSRTDKNVYKKINVNIEGIDATGHMPIAPIEIKTDEHLTDHDMVEASVYADKLSDSVEIIRSSGETDTIPVYNWYYNTQTTVTGGAIQYTFKPSFEYQYTAYYNYNFDDIRADIIVDPIQTEIRPGVTDISYINTPIEIKSDLFLCRSYQLEGQYFENKKVTLTATLEDGTTKEISAEVNGINDKNSWWSDEGSPYEGDIGTYTFNMYLKLPRDQYRFWCSSDVEQTFLVTVKQTPDEESIWVTQKPKLTYKAGETLDLSGMLVQVRTDNPENYKEVKIVSKDAVASGEIKIILHLYDSNNEVEVKEGTPIIAAYDKAVIEVQDAKNSYSTYFGRLVVN
ncbi:MAG: hypothetical protein PWP24_1081 [Clostridiales bacterium]|nr:hypothetical protein [Clostridiales bacterium]